MSELRADFQLTLGEFKLEAKLALPAKGITGIFGHSGSGKTTLLRCIAGLERVPNGYVSVAGEVWQDQSVFLATHRRPLGYVFQEASLFSHLTVRGNLEYGLRRLPMQERKVYLEQAVDMLNLDDLLERMPEKLSGGERQRVAIARAIAVSPRLLLMDEPLASLDQSKKHEILPYLEVLHDELDIPILYVSHSADEVAKLADHLVVMERGKVLASGPLNETVARIDLPVRLGEEAGVVIEAVVAERDERWSLAKVTFSGGHLWMRDAGCALGRKVRIRILARDASLGLTQQGGTSIQNSLPCEVVDMVDAEHPALTIVRVKVGETIFMAQLTKQSASMLALTVGSSVWIQIKTSALIG